MSYLTANLLGGQTKRMKSRRLRRARAQRRLRASSPGGQVRCNSWEAIIDFYYADEVPPMDWPTKHIESYRLACTSLGEKEGLRAAFRSRYAA